MNIIKIQDQLKNVPDNTLVGYVQNPTGQVPTYLALSELQRRKEMRSKYQAAKPEEKTVAEDLVQESQPGVMGLPQGQAMQQAMQPPPEMPAEQMAQGGLADLDVGDMYDENNYANGGIVAFGDGGYVPRFAGSTDGSYISPNIYTASPEQTTAMRDVQAKIEEGKRQAAKIAIQKSQQGIPLTMDEKALLQERGVVNAMSGPTSAVPVDLPSAPTINKKPAVDIAKDTTQDKNVPPKLINPFEGYPGSYTPEKVKSIAEYGKEFQDFLGTDPNRAAIDERLAKMTQRATKMEEQAPWLALAQAGFKMASQRPQYGKGQSALADIAEGAGVGIKEYAEAKDKLATLEEKRFAILNDIAKADRAERIAIGKYGADSKQAIEERNFREKLQDKHDKILYQMNKEDNLAALNKAVTGKTPTVAENMKIRDYVEGKIGAEKALILKRLGGNAEKEGSDNYNQYLKEMADARRRLAIEAMSNPLSDPANAASPNVAATYVPGKGFQ
jgi:hypothetical protein